MIDSFYFHKEGATNQLRISCTQLFILAGILFVLISCNQDNVVVKDDEQNLPRYLSRFNMFEYSINANDLTETHYYPLNFASRWAQIETRISENVEGSAIFTLNDSSSATIRVDTFLLTGIYHIVDIVGRPASILVGFQNFTGDIHYTITAQVTGNGLRVDEFPQAPGTCWTYSVYDSVNGTTDTLDVTVLHDTVVNTIAATLWQFAYRSHTDTQYVSSVEDTIRFYEPPLFENHKYIFPLEVGIGWSGDYAVDTSIVLLTENVSVPAGVFPNSFLVKEIRYTPLQSVVESYVWLAQNVGVVKLRRKIYDWRFPDNGTTWELIHQPAPIESRGEI